MSYSQNQRGLPAWPLGPMLLNRAAEVLSWGCAGGRVSASFSLVQVPARVQPFSFAVNYLPPTYYCETVGELSDPR